MANNKHTQLFALLFFLISVCYKSFSASSTPVDSLIKVSQSLKDTSKIKMLIKIATEYITLGKMDEAEKYLLKAHDENTVIKSRQSELLIALKTIYYHYKKSKYKLAYELGEETLPIAISLKNSDAIAECKMYMGMCVARLGNFTKGLEYYLQALTLLENQKSSSLQMKLYSNIAGMYYDQLDYKSAIYYFKKTLEMALQKNDSMVIGQSYNNIGSAFENSGNQKEAKEYYLKAVQLNSIINNKYNLGYNYMNLASLELQDHHIKEAKEYNKKAVAIFTASKDMYSLVSCLWVDGDIFIAENKIKEAVDVFAKCVTLSEKTGSPLLTERTYIKMSFAYEKAGDLKQAMLYLKKYMNTKDSIINTDIRAEVTKKQLHYEFDKKHLADSLVSQSKQKYLQQEVENNKRSAALQRNISIISLLSLLIVAILAFYIYRGLKKNRQSSKIIQEQKRIVEGKNKEILDSISYAKRIQGSILPSNRLVKNYFKDSFILYKPKDLVAGDFYWMETIIKQSSDCLLFAAADCTGHGVPGALVSVVCHNALNRAVREFNISDPGKILDKTRNLVIAEFEKSEEEEVMDGMDISLCLLDLKTKHLKWAGANSPLWIIRNNELIEVKPDKQPIGKFESAKPFTTHQLQLQSNDCLYIFTDGYQDQFGGESAKKFKGSKFKELLGSINGQSMEDQRQSITQAYYDWKGELEQVDDICVIGIRF